MAVSRTPHYDIMKYWVDKFITKDGRVLTVDEWREEKKQECESVVMDAIEPKCWGCGLPVRFESEKSYERLAMEGDCKKVYEKKEVKHKLERCHIVPGSLGGEDKPDNLFLLCAQCHIESPDTTNKSTFFRWVYRQRKNYDCGIPTPKVAFRRIEEELESRGLPSLKETMDKIDAADKNGEMTEWFQDGTFKQYFKENIGTHLNKISVSSVYGAFADVLEAMLEDAGKVNAQREKFERIHEEVLKKNDDHEANVDKSSTVTLQYRPERGTIDQSIKEQKVYHSYGEMKTDIHEQYEKCYCVCPFDIEEIVILKPYGDDERLGWKNVSMVCVNRFFDEDYKAKYGRPKLIGYCCETENPLA